MVSQYFKIEKEFESFLVEKLEKQGWEKYGSGYPDEKKLIAHWKDIISQRNSDVLKNVPLTDNEMRQIIGQINNCKTALDIHTLLLGESVYITRNNQSVRLNLFNPYANEDSTVFEVIEQPQLKIEPKEYRGDIELLINGMPLVHIELKNETGNVIEKAESQVHDYLHWGCFDNGYFSLIQLFVVMTPQETLYFAKPNKDEIDAEDYNSVFHFHWTHDNDDDPQENNRPINDGKNNKGECVSIVQTLLSPDVIFKLVGLYMIADKSDGTLKVLRSYQYYAIEKILKTLQNHCWDDTDPQNQLGGFIWHTTGSGKTMTSFKAASLISQAEYTRQDSKKTAKKYSYADKIIFLMDRTELGNQSLSAFQSFVDGLTPEEAKSRVSGTTSTRDLARKIVQNEPRIIVTSIQKMYRINTSHTDLSLSTNSDNDSNENDKLYVISPSDQKNFDQKRIVFIIDECHRSTFGMMLSHIKSSFPRAVFFGFTGTPIKEVNQKNRNTTTSLFGNELHRYTITDGLRDNNVLGFDPYYFKPDDSLKKIVALKEIGFTTEEDFWSRASAKERNRFNELIALDWPEKSIGDDDKEHNGIENYLKNNNYYDESSYRERVVQSIYDNFTQYNYDCDSERRYSAIFATSSIFDAIEYYDLFKKKIADHKKNADHGLVTVTALFDPSSSYDKNTIRKADAITHIMKDYGKTFFDDDTHFMPKDQKDASQKGSYDYDGFKADISARLAHKNVYANPSTTTYLDLLIVVDQMLTGFDSKWIRTLYLDKVLTYEGLIQAFSRTNRVLDGKQHGTIICYREPYTMEKNVAEAFDLYAGGDSKMVFVPHLEENCEKMRDIYSYIETLFNRNSNGNIDWNHLPASPEKREEFAKAFRELRSCYQAVQPQGFNWSTNESVIGFNLDQYKILTARYGDLPDSSDGHNIKALTDNLHTYDASDINYAIQKGSSINYKYLQSLIEAHLAQQEDQQEWQQKFNNALAKFPESIQEAIKEICEHYSSYKGDTLEVKLEDYFQKQANQSLDNIVNALGCDKTLLQACLNCGLTQKTIKEDQNFDKLVQSCESSSALKEYLKKCEWKGLLLRTPVRQLLKHYILHPDFDINNIQEAKQILNS